MAVAFPRTLLNVLAVPSDLIINLVNPASLLQLNYYYGQFRTRISGFSAFSIAKGEEPDPARARL